MRAVSSATTFNIGVPSSPALLCRLHSLVKQEGTPRPRTSRRSTTSGYNSKPVEFGYKAQLVDNEDGVIVDHIIEVGNPPDAPMLVPAVERVTRRVGRPPGAVTADRGYGEQRVEDQLHEHGVRDVVLPRKGKPTAARRAVEQRRAFKKMVRWRTGCEGRISSAKRDYGLARTRQDGIDGARTWCGHGVFTHNLVKIAGLTE
jgi:IS5 family transposase